MKTLALFFTFFGFAFSAHARVGETIKQVETRYGKPQKVLKDGGDIKEFGYGFHGFMVLVTFQNGISKRESIGLPEKLSREQVNEILKLSAPKGMSWKPLLIRGKDYYWVLSGHKTIAQFTESGHLLLIQDRDFFSHK